MSLYVLRLVGGPYDGDESEYGCLPGHLWAYPCDHATRCEGINGIHWGDGNDQFYGSKPGAEEYRYSHQDASHVYRWSQLQSDDSRRLEEALHV